MKACEGLEEGSWEFDMMDQRLGAVGSISEVETEDKIVEVNFGRWDSRVDIQTFVYVRRRPFHPTRLEAVVKELPRALGCGIRPEDAEVTETAVAAAAVGATGGGGKSKKGKAGKAAAKAAEAEAAALAARNSVFSTVIRSKGFVWLATFHTAALYWDHSGGHFSLINIGQWWAATDGGLEGHADEFEGEFGDRRQEIVFIGANLDIPEIEKRCAHRQCR